MNEKSGPAQAAVLVTPNLTNSIQPRSDRLRLRKLAAQRLPYLDCGHADPLSCLASVEPALVGPERFGLTADEAHRHGNDLVAGGWSIDEVVEVLRIEPISNRVAA